MTNKTKVARIAALNDSLRSSFSGGRVILTRGVATSGHTRAITSAVQAVTAFPKGDDPYGEHDFGALDTPAGKVFWKIDYYDTSWNGLSEDPSDPEQTRRVLTVMLASEY